MASTVASTILIICAGFASRIPKRVRPCCSLPINSISLPPPSARFIGALAGGDILQVDQAASAHQTVLRYFGERREIPNLDRRLRLRARGPRQKTPPATGFASHFVTDPFRHPLRKNAHPASVFLHRLPVRQHCQR